MGNTIPATREELVEQMQEAARQSVAAQYKLAGATAMLRAASPDEQAGLLTALQSAAAEALAAFTDAHQAVLDSVDGPRLRVLPQYVSTLEVKP